MRDDVVPYAGAGHGRVIVYDTWANDRRIHFDVFLPYAEAKESDLNRQALAVAKTFLEAMGADPTWVQMSGCSRCHIDELARYEGKLWHVPKQGAWVWPIDGCPKPGDQA